jgi:hypothetical protein
MCVNLELVRRCEHIPECYVCFDHHSIETGVLFAPLFAPGPPGMSESAFLAFSIYGVWEIYTTSSCFCWSLIGSDEKKRRTGGMILYMADPVVASLYHTRF